MDLRTFVRFAIFLAALLALGPNSDASAQLNPAERSSVFAPFVESSLERDLMLVRGIDPGRTPPFEFSNDPQHEGSLPGFSSWSLSMLQSENERDYASEQLSSSLDLFRSFELFAAVRQRAVQRIDERVLANSAPDSRVFAEAALASALEFFSHAPLRRSDIEAGLERLDSIRHISALSAAVQPEALFWRAEGERALGKSAMAEATYREAVAKSSDPHLTALVDFRLGELAERLGDFALADTIFGVASLVAESPLRLMATIRRAAVMRTERKFSDVLHELDLADSLRLISQLHLRRSPRAFDYLSPLVEQLLLRRTEKDRILASAPNEGLENIQPAEYQLASPFAQSEIALIRGSALSELGEYAKSSDVLTAGLDSLAAVHQDSTTTYGQTERQFVTDALKFEKAWSLFQQLKYEDAASAFLQLAEQDTTNRHLLSRASNTSLREQGHFADEFYEETSNGIRGTTLESSALSSTSIDTGAFYYNDFPERSRFYAGVALARAGKNQEAAEIFQRLTQDKSVLYSDKASYQLALVQFGQKNYYQAGALLEPVSAEPNATGAYASFLMGELSYRRGLFERADKYFLSALSGLPLSDSGIRAAAHLERGLSLIVLNQWTEVENELDAYLHDPSSRHISELGKTDEAWFWLGKAELRRGDLDSARTAFENVLAFPNSERHIDAEYGLAWTLFEQNKYDAAAKAFLKVLTMDTITSYSYDALARAADSRYALGDRIAADTLYNLAVDRPAFNPFRTTRALHRLAVTRMMLDSSRSALNEFKYLLRKYPTTDIADRAIFDLALSAYEINLPTEAEAAVERVVTEYRLSPIAPRALMLAAGDRVRRADPKGAIHYYERVLAEYPRAKESGPALFALQDIYLELKKPALALAAADTFVSRNPTSEFIPHILFVRGKLELASGDAHKAVATFEQYVQKYPTDVDIPNGEYYQALATVAAGDTLRAIELFTALATHHDSLAIAPQSYLELARIYRAERLNDSAATNFRKAYAPKYYSTDAAPMAMAEYAQYFIDQGAPDSAIAILNQLVTSYPVESAEVSRAAIKVGELEVDKGKFADARADYLKVASARGIDVLAGDAMVHIGQTYLLEEHYTQAIEAFHAAKNGASLTEASFIQMLLGTAEADSALGKHAEAIAALRSMLKLRGVPEAIRLRAERMLQALSPQKPKSLKPSKKSKKGDEI